MDAKTLSSTATAAAALGLLLSLGALSFDLPCLPGYADSGLESGPGKGAALVQALKLSLQNLSQTLPIFAGFVGLFALALGVPHLAAKHGKSRLYLALAIAPLTVGMALWIALTGPGSDCNVASVATRLLMQCAFGALVLYALAFILGRLSNRA